MLERFYAKYEKLLGEEGKEFKEALKRPPFRGLRINPGKICVKELFNRYGFLEKVPWCSEGFYLPEGLFLGRDPWHLAGAFYLQEPSAMLPVEVLDPKPGEVILDLAAAPGGKATQILSKLGGKGLLVANEINPGRAKILVENLERWGYGNYIVVNEKPNHLEEKFFGYFDRVLVDAPCSGEGMFRKNSDALKEWSEEHVLGCSARQEKLLATAAKLLKEGGVLVYSTCTFNPEENEKVIVAFLRQNPNFVLDEFKLTGISPGIPEWADNFQELRKTYRIWPHRHKGEGHFVARMVKLAGSIAARVKTKSGKNRGKRESLKEFQDFWQEYLNLPVPEVFVKGEKVFLLPEEFPELTGVRVIKAGLQIGEVKKGRFLPSQELAFSILGKNFKRQIEMPQALRAAYLRGESIPVSWEEGWYLVTLDGVGIGFGYVKKGIFKNQLAKYLRGLAL
ncbi:RsmB/NOP family class I SAM-dependent RNA methyltransferase [Carboxydothermus pertinax]|uniref:SAM-dependent MTase RsmB/NOP-type domain-containing protein n=1 Tax=Carboxydothermus pertinax TaxID=870242 RepID=A0A1L8CSA0_9THEO|nr:RsmF rRNA methyltransferase first C-terminal domain-containing protein [Carboxydothermus pertinax]GAV21815.1 hypothetical protein cpu_03250 [Carboxydothermus pertinax]